MDFSNEVNGKALTSVLLKHIDQAVQSCARLQNAINKLDAIAARALTSPPTVHTTATQRQYIERGIEESTQYEQLQDQHHHLLSGSLVATSYAVTANDVARIGKQFISDHPRVWIDFQSFGSDPLGVKDSGPALSCAIAAAYEAGSRIPFPKKKKKHI